MSEGQEFLTPGTAPPKGERGVSVSFEDTGEWATCTVTYYLPNPFPTLFKVIHSKDQMPYHFVFTVKGSAKHEAEDTIAEGSG